MPLEVPNSTVVLRQATCRTTCAMFPFWPARSTAAKATSKLCACSESCLCCDLQAESHTVLTKNSASTARSQSATSKLQRNVLQTMRTSCPQRCASLPAGATSSWRSELHFIAGLCAGLFLSSLVMASLQDDMCTMLVQVHVFNHQCRNTQAALLLPGPQDDSCAVPQ